MGAAVRRHPALHRHWSGVLPHVWEHHYGKFTTLWAALIVIPLFLTADVSTVTTTLAHTAFLEYMPPILLLLALFTVAGGIYLEGNLHDSVFTNTVLLAVGAVMASIVGTTGAAMILIRPLIRANDNRRYNAHVVVFFIFVANIGGALSPLATRRCSSAFKGVDFFWTTKHLCRRWWSAARAGDHGRAICTCNYIAKAAQQEEGSDPRTRRSSCTAVKSISS